MSCAPLPTPAISRVPTPPPCSPASPRSSPAPRPAPSRCTPLTQWLVSCLHSVGSASIGESERLQAEESPPPSATIDSAPGKATQVAPEAACRAGRSTAASADLLAARVNSGQSGQGGQAAAGGEGGGAEPASVAVRAGQRVRGRLVGRLGGYRAGGGRAM